VTKEIKTGIEINLKDLFSAGMSKAAKASDEFAEKTIGAIGTVDKAISGTAAKLGALGVTLSLGAAAKGIIEMDHRMTRMGLSVSASAEQMAKMKQTIFDVAQASDVKIDPSNILSGIEVIISQTSDLKYAENNIRNIALAIQATGESGESMGALFSEFRKFEYSTEQISSLMDDMAAQANEGAFSLADFAKAAPQLFPALEEKKIKATPENIKKVNTALQIINAGAKNPTKAVGAFNSALNELGDPDKQKKLRQIGISVRDPAGNFRDFNDIMFDIVAKANELGSTDRFNNIFSSSTMQAMRSYMTHGERMYENLTNLGDTAGLLQKQSETMAGTLQSNIKNLQTAFNNFANSNLTKPLEHLTGLLNKLAEDPKKLEAVFNAIKRGVLIIGGLKIGAGIMSFLSTIRNFQGGSVNANITEKMSLQANSTAMPVYVTNWSGAASGSIGAAGLSGARTGGLVDQYGNPMPPPVAGVAPPTTTTPPVTKGKWNLNKPNMKGAVKAGAGAAAITAVMALPGMINELGEISKQEDLTKEERGKAKGGAIGDFAGSVTGAAAGAIAGAAIVSVVPVVGTAVGALVGGIIGQFGGPVGRFIGEKVGAAVSKEKPEQAAFDKAQTEYATAIINAGDTVGKTSQEINEARLKVVEAEKYLEETKAALEAAGKTQYADKNGGKKTPLWQQASRREAFPSQNGNLPEYTLSTQSGRNETPNEKQASFETAMKMYQGGGMRIPSMQAPSQIRIPEYALPPQITKNESPFAPPAKAEIEGQASIDVNVNISGERPTARVAVKNNNMPFVNFRNNGNAAYARLASS
jgi:phage tail tape-measure protein